MTYSQGRDNLVRTAPLRAARSTLPFLLGASFGLIAALDFVNHNYDQIFPSEIAGLTGAVAALGAAWYGLLHLVLRDQRRAGIAAAVTTYVGLNHEGLHENFTRYIRGSLGSRFGFLVLMLAGMFVSICLMKRMSEYSTKTIARALGLTAAVFLAMNCYIFAAHVATNRGVQVEVANEDIVAAAGHAKPDSKPDIYYIMPDDYVGEIALSETYSFDNQDFTSSLKALGFYVPAQSFSNYPITTTSLASSINGGLLKPGGDYLDATARAAVYSLIQKPEVARFLQKQGYTFIQLGSWWNATQTSQYADRNLRHGYGITLMGYSFQVSEFIGVFIQRTIFWSVLEGGLRFRGTAIAAWDGDTGQIFLDQTRELEKIASEGGAPRFVFTHLLMPHLPTVFDSDGRPTPPGLSEKEAYLRQVQFTNSKLIEQVRNIQATERGRQAVIVLASDEGQFPDNNTITATDQQLRHKSNTLASLYFPDHDYSLLYPAITPVNYFRVIFNKYFGTHLDFQPDTVYAYRRSSLFLLDLADVTKRVRPIGLLEPGAGLF